MSNLKILLRIRGCEEFEIRYLSDAIVCNPGSGRPDKQNCHSATVNLALYAKWCRKDISAIWPLGPDVSCQIHHKDGARKIMPDGAVKISVPTIWPVAYLARFTILTIELLVLHIRAQDWKT